MAIKGYIESQQPVYEDDYYKDFKSDSELEMKYSKLGDYEVAYEEHESDNKLSNSKLYLLFGGAGVLIIISIIIVSTILKRNKSQ